MLIYFEQRNTWSHKIKTESGMMTVLMKRRNSVYVRRCLLLYNCDDVLC